MQRARPLFTAATSSSLLQQSAYKYAASSSSSSSSSSAAATFQSRRSFHPSLHRQQDDTEKSPPIAEEQGIDVQPEDLQKSPATQQPSEDAQDSKMTTTRASRAFRSPLSALFAPLGDGSSPSSSSVSSLSPSSKSSEAETSKSSESFPYFWLTDSSPSSPDSSRPGTAYEGLFDSPNPYDRIPPSRGFLKRSTSRSRSTYPNLHGQRNDVDGGHNSPMKLDPAERRQWQKLLADVASSFGTASDRESTLTSPLDGALGSFVKRNDLEDLRLKTRRARGTQHKSGMSDGSGRLALLNEGIGSDMSVEDIEAGVDLARQEMNTQMNEADLWSWAAKEVWGYDEQSRQTEKTETPSEANLSQEKPRTPYGVDTPFYGPVLHQLLIHFRDRLKSPTSALAVLQITRAKSTHSLVLGCTAELYTEAIRTLWEEWGDARGCLELLKEAKETGIIGNRLFRASANSRDSNRYESSGGSERNTRSLLGVARSIQGELRRRALAGRAKVEDGKVLEGETELKSEELEPGRDVSPRSLFLPPPEVEPPAPSNTIGLESLSLAAIQSLFIADDLGSIMKIENTKHQSRDHGMRTDRQRGDRHRGPRRFNTRDAAPWQRRSQDGASNVRTHRGLFR